jgi:hypothetical protein
MSFLSNILQYVEKANLLPPGIKTLIEEVLTHSGVCSGGLAVF